ncbi:carbamoyl-phosphate synthase large chain [Actinoplanes sp. SE50]|uniref:ATP-grasp domain-containing protein n=1 Tax=unclassified Actinoplanes TaxID=2626549 RepID=UPI00023ECBAA|nr:MULTISPECIES: ATP-grasp domain-containing protein [unclassified Actinoplanes]AEV87122.1 Carbamoyl-phosphate synthase large chain [Actinoplanes sp. SE50/110]ATO85520.1 carbamoyl-phosphate synthase large chain [Actinoplanes sp. SE50]SLM02933.1 carbamoyl-phosphate synthase large chain [Actinoplanes sp. SE50/110]
MLLFVESAPTGAGMSHVRWAVDHGFDAAYVSANPEWAPERLGGEVMETLESRGRVFKVPSSEVTEVPAWLVSSIEQAAGPSGVVCGLDRSLPFAAALAEAVGAPYPSVPAMQTFRDKRAARRLYDKLGITSARWAAPADADEFVAFTEEIGGPVVLKNCRGTGSMDVRLVESSTEARERYLELSNAERYLDGDLMAEEYLTGPLYSLETIVSDGTCHHLGVTDRQIGPNPGFCEVSYTFPVQVPWQYENEMRRAVEACVQAYGIRQGMLHTEFIVTSHGAAIVELNVRHPGGLLTMMMSDCLNSSVSEILSLSALQMPLPDLSHNGKASTTVTVYPQVAGRLVQMRGLDEVGAAPFVVQALPSAAPGDWVQPPTDYRGALCQIRTVAESSNLSFNAAMAAARGISAVVE